MLIFFSDKGITSCELEKRADVVLEKIGKKTVDIEGRTGQGAPISRNYRVSVTHTDNVTLLALSDKAVGIDIERNGRRVPKSMKDVRNWTAYEAKRKMTGEGIRLSEIRAGGDYTEGVTFHTFIDGYTVAVAGGDPTLFVICV